MTEPPDPPNPPDPEPEPAPPGPSYELPGPRRVVAAGLQLAMATAGDLRRASIYVGLLALAAFGPAVVYLIATVDHFDLDLAAMLDDLAFGDGLFFFNRPELLGPLLFVEALVGCGLVLLFAISIDAQAIGIGLLAGHAATRPVSLAEAVARARQVFWRLLGGSLLVGVYTTVIQVVLGLVLRTDQAPNLALEFSIAILATLATVPFAYLATGIVLGDVGPSEALRRSTRLFQARPATALVVVLFTLVTAAIETFALGAGLDIVAWAGELLGLDVTAGGAALILPIILSLASVTAFGSLLLTITALVSAPQVAAFLGLTFYGGGLDRARADGGRPAGFRWVTRPMQVAFLLLAAVSLLGIPTVTLSQPGGSSRGEDGPLVALLTDAAARSGDELVIYGAVAVTDDPIGDQAGDDGPIVDIVSVEYVLLDTVPDWLLDDVFPCGLRASVCGGAADERWPFEEGALLFRQEMAAAVDVGNVALRGSYGPLLGLEGFDSEPIMSGTYLAGVSQSYLTRVAGGVSTIHAEGELYLEYPTYARSAWVGPSLLTVIPLIEIPAEPVGWDVRAATETGSHDTLRAVDGGPLVPFTYPALIEFVPPASD